jgi:hypothetical protein
METIFNLAGGSDLGTEEGPIMLLHGTLFQSTCTTLFSEYLPLQAGNWAGRYLMFSFSETEPS